MTERGDRDRERHRWGEADSDFMHRSALHSLGHNTKEQPRQLFPAASLWAKCLSR